MENNNPDSNIVKTLLFVPKKYERYKYYANSNFQEPRPIHRDDIGKFVFPFLKDSDTCHKLLDFLQAHKTFFIDADAGEVVELLADYEANKAGILKILQDTKLADALADKQERQEASRVRKPIMLEDKYESMVDSMYRISPPDRKDFK